MTGINKNNILYFSIIILLAITTVIINIHSLFKNNRYDISQIEWVELTKPEIVKRYLDNYEYDQKRIKKLAPFNYRKKKHIEKFYKNNPIIISKTLENELARFEEHYGKDVVFRNINLETLGKNHKSFIRTSNSIFPYNIYYYSADMFFIEANKAKAPVSMLLIRPKSEDDSVFVFRKGHYIVFAPHRNFP